MIMSEENWERKKLEFWRLRATEGDKSTFSRDEMRRYDRDADSPSVVELSSYVDCYNPHGAYHYGGSLPLTPLQQVNCQ